MDSRILALPMRPTGGSMVTTGTDISEYSTASLTSDIVVRLLIAAEEDRSGRVDSVVRCRTRASLAASSLSPRSDGCGLLNSVVAVARDKKRTGILLARLRRREAVMIACSSPVSTSSALRIAVLAVRWALVTRCGASVGMDGKSAKRIGAEITRELTREMRDAVSWPPFNAFSETIVSARATIFAVNSAEDERNLGNVDIGSSDETEQSTRQTGFRVRRSNKY